MQAVVVTFDSLAASVLGCYGNEWIETPNFDRLASQGVVFDCHFAEHVGSSTGMSWSTGLSPHDGSPQAYPNHSGWTEQLKNAGIEIDLVREEDALPWSLVLNHSSLESIAGQRDTTTKPDQIPFAQAVKCLTKKLAKPDRTGSSPTTPRILWLHSAGVPEICEPPEGFATLYFEDFEEREFDMQGLPAKDWKFHPAVYAGYVSLLDYWLGELVKSIEEHSQNESTLLIVTSARGVNWLTRLCHQPITSPEEATSHPVLNDHQNEGPKIEINQGCHPLSDIITQTPLLIRIWDHDTDESASVGGQEPKSFASEFAGTRSRQLVSHSGLSSTLLEFFQVVSSSDTGSTGGFISQLEETRDARAAICFTNGAGSRGIRTDQWALYINSEGPNDGSSREMNGQIERSVTESKNEPTIQLFVKPDDLWESFDVSGQHRDLTARLVESLDEQLPSVATSLNRVVHARQMVGNPE